MQAAQLSDILLLLAIWETVQEKTLRLNCAPLEDVSLSLPLNLAHSAPLATGDSGYVVWSFQLEGVKIKNNEVWKIFNQNKKSNL